jgi:hypothetical protein
MYVEAHASSIQVGNEPNLPGSDDKDPVGIFPTVADDGSSRKVSRLALEKELVAERGSVERFSGEHQYPRSRPCEIR